MASEAPGTASSVPGVRPALQRRSRARHAAMLAAGIKLVNARDWSEVSVADIAAANGHSVGSFYTRFRDKDAYFEALQETVAAEFRRGVEAFFVAPQRGRESATQLLASYIRLVLGAYRANRGLFAAAIKYATAHPAAWRPLVQLRERAEALLREALCERRPAQRRFLADRVAFAGQMLNGTLLNAILNRPGPIQLDQPAMQRELITALTAYLRLEEE